MSLVSICLFFTKLYVDLLDFSHCVSEHSKYMFPLSLQFLVKLCKNNVFPLSE